MALVCHAHGRVVRTLVKRFGVASTTALAIPDRQRIHMSRIRAMRNERESVRALSSKLDLDGLMSANRWGGAGKTATARPADPSADSNPLDALMNKNKYGGRKKEKESEHDGALVNYAPEYPYDIDAGPLFCTRANRCFLDGGKRCGEYQTGKRNKGMLEDLYRVCKNTGFFFIHNTFLTSKDLEQPYNHMAAIYAEEEARPGGLGIDAPQDATNLGFSRPGIDKANPISLLAKHVCFSVRKEPVDNSVTNKWPSDSFRPGLKSDTIKFYNEMNAVAKKIAQALGDMMGLASDELLLQRSDRCMSGLQLLHFSPDPNVRTDAEGLDIVKDSGWRTDPGLFLIISQTEPCFQVQDVQGQTGNLRCGQERFIVLLGDVIEIISNGHIKATKFRVLPRNGERAAISFAARLDPSAVVAPLEMFVEEGAARLPTTTQEQLMSSVVEGLSCWQGRGGALSKALALAGRGAALSNA